MRLSGALCLLFLPASGLAEPQREVAYASLEALPHRIETFDEISPAPEPGVTFDQHWRGAGLTIAEHLAGQTVVTATTPLGAFDRLRGAPVFPLRARPGQPGQNVTIAFHAGFGSNALFPVGPRGAERIDGRGEGALALTFDTAQMAFGLRLQGEYPDPLGKRPDPGIAVFSFYDAQANPVARMAQPLRHGVMDLAWRFDLPVAAMTIETTDPGGIAVDDILYNVVDLTG